MPKEVKRLEVDEVKTKLNKAPAAFDMLKKNAARSKEEKSFDQSIKDYDKEIKDSRSKGGALKDIQNKRKELRDFIDQQTKRVKKEGGEFDHKAIVEKIDELRLDSIDNALKGHGSESFKKLKEDLDDAQNKAIEVAEYKDLLKWNMKRTRNPFKKMNQKRQLWKVDAFNTLYQRKGNEIRKRLGEHNKDYSNQLNNFKYQMDIKDQAVTRDDGLKDYYISNPTDVAKKLVADGEYESTADALKGVKEWSKKWQEQRTKEQEAKSDCDKADVALGKLNHEKNKCRDKEAEAKEALEKIRRDYDSEVKAFSVYNDTDDDPRNKAKTKLEAAETKLGEAKAKFEQAGGKVDDQGNIIPQDDKEIPDKAQKAYAKALAEYGEAQDEHIKAQDEHTKAEQGYTNAEVNSERAEKALEKAEDAHTKAKGAHTKAQESYDRQKDENDKLYKSYKETKDELFKLQDNPIALAIEDTNLGLSKRLEKLGGETKSSEEAIKEVKEWHEYSQNKQKEMHEQKLAYEKVKSELRKLKSEMKKHKDNKVSPGDKENLGEKYKELKEQAKQDKKKYKEIKKEIKELNKEPAAKLTENKIGNIELYHDISWKGNEPNALSKKIEAMEHETDMEKDRLDRLEKQKLKTPGSSWRSWRGPKARILYPIKLVYGLGKDISNFSKLELHEQKRIYDKQKGRKELRKQFMKKIDGSRSFDINDATLDKVTIEEFAKQDRALRQKDYERHVDNFQELENRRDSVGKAMARIESKIKKASDKKKTNYESWKTYGSKADHGWHDWYYVQEKSLKVYRQYLNWKSNMVESRVEKWEQKLAEKEQKLGYKPDIAPYGGPEDGYDYTPQGRFLKAFKVRDSQWGKTDRKEFEQWNADMRRHRRHERDVLFNRGRADRGLQRLENKLKDLEDSMKQEEDEKIQEKGKELAKKIKGQIEEYKDYKSKLDDYIESKGDYQHEGIKKGYKDLLENPDGSENVHAGIMRASRNMKERADLPKDYVAPPKPLTKAENQGNGNGFLDNLFNNNPNLANQAGAGGTDLFSLLLNGMTKEVTEDQGTELF